MRARTSRVIMDEMCSISRGMGKIMLEVLPFCLICPLICGSTSVTTIVSEPCQRVACGAVLPGDEASRRK